ncbi:MAG: EVE domain-containing protein [Proteobacteria bacterium]|nr:EVE domain-containing protein [Pseudomonadota bacterium]MCH9758183.1 EVE domain-containing protein [Pseudomonadota bacterium]
MAYWLFKSEPVAYSIDDLARDGCEWWDGIRNYQARNFMCNDMQVGDEIIFYHSSCAVPAAVGRARVSATAIADVTQFDPKSDYYDASATAEKPRWHCVQIAFVEKFPQPLTLAAMRAMPKLAEMKLLARGNRLSILPLTPKDWKIILAATGTH